MIKTSIEQELAEGHESARELVRERNRRIATPTLSQSGSTEAVSILAVAYREHRAGVYRYLLTKTRDPNVAEDLTQEVFLDAASLHADADVSAGLLYVIAHRRYIDEVRANCRRREVLRLYADALGDAEGPASYHGFGRQIRDAVLRLPPGERRVFVMRLFEGRRFAEIACHLRITEAACRRRFVRARQTVSEHLGDDVSTTFK